MTRWTTLAITVVVLFSTQAMAGGIIQEMKTTSQAFTAATNPCSSAGAQGGLKLKDPGSCSTSVSRPKVSLSTSLEMNDTVTWNAFSLDGLKAKSYKIIRKCGDETDWETIATVDGDVFAFIDTQAKDKPSCDYNVIGVYDSKGGEREYNFQEQREVNSPSTKKDVPEQGMACQTHTSPTPSLWFLLLLPALFLRRRRNG